MAKKRVCMSCNLNKAAIYHTTGDFCQKCFSDRVAGAKAKIYAHLCELGLKRKDSESKTDWMVRVKEEYQKRVKKLAKSSQCHTG